jgi:hypothetical protein
VPLLDLRTCVYAPADATALPNPLYSLRLLEYWRRQWLNIPSLWSFADNRRRGDMRLLMTNAGAMERKIGLVKGPGARAG